MSEAGDYNPVFKIATDFVNHTDRCVFLTGKAGSGKTTFLRHIAGQTPKNCVVVAPTGVAAINAGGVTMHSFFQLPFGPFLPAPQKKFNGVEVVNSYSLLKNLRLGRDKQELIDELELLIIDEVSMVRCDLLDAVDTIMRHVRKSRQPFGGVQVLFIGDLFQLPPVARQEEWELLKEHYESPFFFHSKVVRENPPLYIELKHIYRQTDQRFIDLLNRVRNNEVNEDDLATLNERMNIEYHPSELENFITLCTHNYKADAVNSSALAKLPGSIHTFRGNIEGEFSDKALPTEMELQLKVGAQIIFIKNDSDPQRRYYNGRIGIIKSIDKEEIRVLFPETGDEIMVDRETWVNMRYAYDRENESIEEEEIGSFKQFPIRLAWAITIHKSQGLTFKNAIIDAGSSFAPGQVYVALSRCTSLNGMVLRSRIVPGSISTDPHVLYFASRENAAHELEQLLATEKQRFGANQLLQMFDFHKPLQALEYFLEDLPRKKIPDPVAARQLAEGLVSKLREKQVVADKFQPELVQLLSQLPAGMKALEERTKKAIVYFTTFFKDEMITPLQEHERSFKQVTKVKKYLRTVGDIRQSLIAQVERLRAGRYGEIVFYPFSEKEAKELESMKKVAVPKKEKAEKGNSLKETLAMYRAGKTLEEISAHRHLAKTTLEGHLAQLIKSGDLDIREIMSEERLQTILTTLEAGDTSSLTEVRGRLGDEYSYGEIRAVMNHRQKQPQE